MVTDTAKQLARELKASEEYRAYAEARERAMENTTTRALIDEYNKLQIRAQAAMISGDSGNESIKKLQKIGELLQFDSAASAYLMAEYRIKRTLGDVYKILAEAVDVDLGPLEG
ncbi:MAG: YlbF family regulator [Clostridiaceae bacterium]|nr:YlbF family regulator [Feifaniaceae bacterium]